MIQDVLLKRVILDLDENEICVLDSIMNRIFNDFPEYTSSRSDVKDLRTKIQAAVEEII